VSAPDGRAFWSKPILTSLKRKCGVYIFALRAAKGFQPWYVGRASKGFEQETFTPHKLARYNTAMAMRAKGSPVLFFVGPAAGKKKVPTRELAHMEKELIQDAFRKNSKLTNNKNTKNLPRWSIKGVVRSPRGRPTEAEAAFGKMLKL
jgi:hypothetical protein